MMAWHWMSTSDLRVVARVVPRWVVPRWVCATKPWFRVTLAHLPGFSMTSTPET
jgi:hypothetical protein